MAQFPKPDGLNIQWASAGDILDPGDTKYQTGWTPEIPPRQWENYIQNKQDNFISHLNQHGICVWDATTEYQWTALGAKSLVMGSDGAIYRTLTTNTNQDPTLTVGVHWEIAFSNAGDFYTKVEADALYLAKAQNLADLTNFTTARTNLSVYSQAQTYTKTEVDAKTTVASTPQAQAGTSNTVIMSPLRTEEWGAANLLGMGQTWQNVTGSRALNTTYTNTTGRPIEVVVSLLTTTSEDSLSVIVSGITILTGDLGGDVGEGGVFSFIVPSSSTYRLTSTGNTLSNWAELR